MHLLVEFLKQLNQQSSKTDLIELYRQMQNIVKYVPYRLLRPFFKNELTSHKDATINTKIKKLSSLRFEDAKPFYKFRSDYIELHPFWKSYFAKHSKIIKGFIYWELFILVEFYV